MKKAILLAVVTAAVLLMPVRTSTAYYTPDRVIQPQRVLISDTTLATVYNAVPEQCNEDCLHTASMFALDPSKISEYRIIAMERTMMEKNGIEYGDKVYVEGTGEYDGVWTVEDTMNRRFAGKHRIDFLVPNHIKSGMWENVKVYKIPTKV